MEEVVQVRYMVSDVQAAVFEDGDRSFWGVQYHPEFTLAQIAALFRRRAARLTRDGFARTEAEIEALSDDFMGLHLEPSRRDLAWRYGIGQDILDDSIHRREFANWLAVKVSPRASSRR